MDEPKSQQTRLEAMKEALARAQVPAERLKHLIDVAQELLLSSPAEAEPLMVEAKVLAEQLGNKVGLAAVERLRAHQAWHAGDTARAQELAQQALALAEQACDNREQAGAIMWLGTMAAARADYDKARECYERCRELSREIGHVQGVLSALNQLGNLALLRGQLDEALVFYQECLEANEEVVDAFNNMALHINIGHVLQQMGRWEDAAENLYRAIAVCERQGYAEYRYNALDLLGELFLKRDKPDRAIDMLEQAAEAGRRQEAGQDVRRDALSNLGEAYLRHDDWASAGRAYAEALELSRESGDRRAEAIILRRMAELTLSRGLFDRARELAGQSLALAREVQLRIEEGEALRVQGLIGAREGRPDAARNAFEDALEALAESEDSFELARVRFEYGSFLIGQGESAMARDYLKSATKTFRRLSTVAEAEEVNRLLFRLELDTDRDMALLQGISGLSALGLDPTQFVGQALGLMCEALGYERGALVVNGRAVVHCGRPDLKAAEELMRSGEAASSGTALAFPVRQRGRALGTVLLERSTPATAGHNPVIVDTLADLLAVMAQRLADSPVRSGLEEQPAGLEYRGFIGANPTMQALFAEMGRLAGESVPVLIRGERGAGKRLAARALHDSGPRSGRRLLAINCPALPADALVGELLTTGASRPGCGVLSAQPPAREGGTVLLHEIADSSPALQAELLGLIATGKERNGPRFVATTSRDLNVAMEQGRFNVELSRILGASEMVVPALRDRKDDLPGLVQYLIDLNNQEFGRQVGGASPAFIDRLLAHNWPGNVRELRQVIERAVLLASGPMLELADLPADFTRPAAVPAG